MENCMLCFNFVPDVELLQLDNCFTANLTGAEVIQQHFAFAEKIFTSDVPRVLCQVCWSNCENFHEFYSIVASNYEVQILEEVEEDVKVKIESIDVDNEMYEEYIQDEQLEYKSEDEYVEEIAPESPEYIPKVPKKKKPKISSNTTPKIPRPWNNQVDPADDKKIALFATMACELCEAPLESMANATAHFRKKHNMKGYLMCCGRRFTQRYRLVDHVNTHLNISYMCQVCGKKFDTKQYLRNHMVHHEDNKAYECDRCGKSFAKKFLIKNHMQTVHVYDNVEPSFACHYEGCEKVYVNAVRLKHHIKYSHENVDKEICEVCSKTFSLKNSLDEHMKIHTRRPEDRFKCEICGHFISDRKTFNKHVKNHETEALDNTCHYCGKKSPNLNALKRHIRYVHETVPTHQCRFCEKVFKRPRDLIDHEAAIHTHQELYDCTFCPKTFRNQSNMLSHRKKDHPESYVKPAYMRDI